MHDWLKNFHKADYVFAQIMDDSDRNQVFVLLKKIEQPGHPRSAERINPTSQVNLP